MHNNSTMLPGIPVEDGVIILYGISQLKTEGGRLVVNDGFANQRRQDIFSKATCGIKRAAILGIDGFITFSALKWLFDIGAGVIQVGWDGEVIFASAPHYDHVIARRAQYRALDNKNGFEFTGFLISALLHGQYQVLKKFTPEQEYSYQDETFNSAYLILTLASRIQHAKTIRQVLGIEALASSVYRAALAQISLQFRQARNIPEHWRTFGMRHSLLNKKSNQNATNPANAMLNYLYALLYAEIKIAALIRGFDPLAGIFHTDDNYRGSFIYDCIEALRPEVDLWLLNFVASRSFERSDFHETSSGSVRVTLNLSPELAATLPLWRRRADPLLRALGELLKGGGIIAGDWYRQSGT